MFYPKYTASGVNRHKVWSTPRKLCGSCGIFLYLSSLYDIIELHSPNVADYADDTQLYLGFNPSCAEEGIQAVKDTENCISGIRAWMLTHRLKINDDKTELLVIGTNQQLAKVPNLSIKVGSAEIKTSDTARNLGIIFDNKMTLEKYVNNISKKAFSQLRRLRQIRQYLAKEAPDSSVHSFVTSTLDYCNALLYGCSKHLLDKLQKIQNCAARVVMEVVNMTS